jgi:Family of unknown function (DUF6263)
MSFVRSILMIAAGLLLAASTAQAQTLLRWKLKAGDAFVVDIEQQTESQVAFSGKSATSKINLGMRLRWQVSTADETAITVKQTIERLNASLTAPTGSAEYDSATKSRPVGLAKELGEALQPLVGAEIDVVLTPRGEVTSTRPANAAAQALFVAAEKSADPSGATRSAVQQAVLHSILPLPEQEVSSGDSWTTKQDISTPAGPLQHETAYTLQKIIERGERPLCQIASLSKLPSSSQSGGRALRIKSHEQTGTILFSADEGRAVEAEQAQKLSTERSYRDTTIVVTLTSTQKTTIEPSAKP